MTASTAFPINPAHCPLCRRPNRCAMEIERETGQAQGPCWCTTQAFAAALLDTLPPAARGKACVCQTCAKAYNPSEVQP